MRDAKLLEWALTHTIDRVEVGYTMLTEDAADEWVRLVDLGGHGASTASIKVTHEQAEKFFVFAPDFPRSIANLRDEVRARREVREQAEALETKELAELKRLKEKYEPTVGRRPRERLDG